MGVRPLSMQSGASREIADGTALLVPRVATLPASPTQGDAVVLTTDGLLYVYDGSAWVAAGLSSELPGGVLSGALADSYATSGAVAGGANDFFVLAIVVLTETRNGAKVEPIISSQTAASSGWHLSIGYGTILSGVYVNTYGLQAANVPSSILEPNTRLGDVLAIGAYFWGASAGSIVTTDLWVGPARRAQSAGGGVGAVVVNSTTALKVLDGAFFGDEGPANMMFLGGGYREGTLTDAQIRAVMGHAQVRGEVPEDLIAWDLVYQGRDGQTAPSSWVPTVGTGTLTRSGTPEAISGLYLPGGGTANNVLVGGGGGGLSEYDVRKRAMVLSRGGR